MADGPVTSENPAEFTSPESKRGLLSSEEILMLREKMLYGLIEANNMSNKEGLTLAAVQVWTDQGSITQAEGEGIKDRSRKSQESVSQLLSTREGLEEYLQAAGLSMSALQDAAEGNFLAYAAQDKVAAEIKRHYSGGQEPGRAVVLAFPHEGINVAAPSELAKSLRESGSRVHLAQRFHGSPVLIDSQRSRDIASGILKIANTVIVPPENISSYFFLKPQRGIIGGEGSVGKYYSKERSIFISSGIALSEEEPRMVESIVQGVGVLGHELAHATHHAMGNIPPLIAELDSDYVHLNTLQNVQRQAKEGMLDDVASKDDLQRAAQFEQFGVMGSSMATIAGCQRPAPASWMADHNFPLVMQNHNVAISELLARNA